MFDIPRELVEDIVDGKVTLFVGAGLSVDAGLPDWDTLIRPLADRLGIPGTLPLNHLDVIGEYVATTSKVHLIKHIQDKTDTTDKNPTDNHRRLARLGIRNWITTNYDDLIEKTLQQTGQRYNVVRQSIALPFIGPDAVTLMQLHGTRQEPGSLVITREDYNLWPTNNPGVYNKLQSFLTETTLLFMGYSLRDPDFGLARDRVSSILGDMMRPSYGVFFDLRASQVAELKRRNVIAINLSVPKGVEPFVMLGIWLEDLIHQVGEERSHHPGKGQLPRAVAELYKTNPPSLQDHARYSADIRKAILSGGTGEFLEIYGESGRGKSRLLLEAMAEVSSRYPQALLIYLNLEFLIDVEPEERTVAAMRGLINAAESRLVGQSSNPDELAALILAQLQSYTGGPVCLIFDTTEALQADRKFWRWVEDHLITPILNTKGAALLFAGRALVPWSREHKRRGTIHLERFEPGHPFLRLAQDVLIRRGTSQLNEAQLQQAQQLALELSSRHPGVCVQVSSYLAQNGFPTEYDKIKTTLGREVLWPFVDGVLLADKDPKSRRILTLISVLEDSRYDYPTLHDFLERTDPLTQYTMYDVQKALQGDFLSRRFDERVSYRFGGYTSSSELQTIVRQCFELNEPDLYRQALAAKESIGGMFVEYDL